VNWAESRTKKKKIPTQEGKFNEREHRFTSGEGGTQERPYKNKIGDSERESAPLKGYKGKSKNTMGRGSKSEEELLLVPTQSVLTMRGTPKERIRCVQKTPEGQKGTSEKISGEGEGV